MTLAERLPARAVLERLNAELTQRQLDVWLLRTCQGWHYQRIADSLGITKPTVYQHYAAAVRKIGRIEWDEANTDRRPT